MNNRDFKGVWIPKEIWLNKDLTITEKFYLSIYTQTESIFETDTMMKAVASDSTIIRCKSKLLKLGLLKFEKITPEQAKLLTIECSNTGEVCSWCGCSSFVLHKHHFPIPRNEGGTKTVNICPNCHYTYHKIVGGAYE